MSRLTKWLRRWQQRDDQHLVKRADPIEELRQIVAEAQGRDVDDERRLYPMFSSSYPRRRSRGGDVFGGR
jgi:hypothetical protein